MVAIPPYRSGQLEELFIIFLPVLRLVVIVAIPAYRSGQLEDLRRQRLDESRREVAIPPYRSGQLEDRFRGRPMGCLQRKSQSHLTDLVSWKVRIQHRQRPPAPGVAIPPYRSGQLEASTASFSPSLFSSVAIPPYRSGQLEGRVRDPLPHLRRERRNPTLPIWSVGRWYKATSYSGDIWSVAIPPYRSGQLEAPVGASSWV